MSVSLGSGLLHNKPLDVMNSTQNAEKSWNKNYDTATDKEIMDVCKEFEAYFLEQIFKNMRNTINKNEESKNQHLEYFEDMQYQQYAKDATEGDGIGLAKMLYDSMKRNYV